MTFFNKKDNSRLFCGSGFGSFLRDRRNPCSQVIPLKISLSLDIDSYIEVDNSEIGKGSLRYIFDEDYFLESELNQIWESIIGSYMHYISKIISPTSIVFMKKAEFELIRGRMEERLPKLSSDPTVKREYRMKLFNSKTPLDEKRRLMGIVEDKIQRINNITDFLEFNIGKEIHVSDIPDLIYNYHSLGEIDIDEALSRLITFIFETDNTQAGSKALLLIRKLNIRSRDLRIALERLLDSDINEGLKNKINSYILNYLEFQW